MVGTIASQGADGEPVRGESTETILGNDILPTIDHGYAVITIMAIVSEVRG